MLKVCTKQAQLRPPQARTPGLQCIGCNITSSSSRCCRNRHGRRHSRPPWAGVTAGGATLGTAGIYATVGIGANVGIGETSIGAGVKNSEAYGVPQQPMMGHSGKRGEHLQASGQ
mmetsp:Transcript_12141/g.30384  ORF Transcript_12141/g.30384 Transcript_12141/m.30384 type:complete len:115 (+) Transcript_12141:40-384(+)